MGEAFETCVFFNGSISICALLDAIKKTGNTLEIESMRMLSSWEDDQEGIDPHLGNADTQSIGQKIVRLRFKIGSIHQGGLYLYKENRHMNVVHFWISCDHIPALSNDFVTEENRAIYDRITQFISVVFSNAGMVFASLGPEIYVEYMDDPHAVMKKSSGVVRWVFAEAPGSPCAYPYTERRSGSFTLFDKQRCGESSSVYPLSRS